MPRTGSENAPDENALLSFVGDVCGMLDIEELRYGLLASLQRLLPSDWISLNDVTPDPAGIVTIVQPDAGVELHDVWKRLAHENPLLRYYLRTQDGRANRFSDVIERDELEALALYRELYLPLGVRHQMAFTLPASPDRVLAIALSRADRDYSDEERDFANRARPFLIQAYLNAIAHQSLQVELEQARGAPLLEVLRAAGLTKREAEVLHLLALGRSNHHIAAALGISFRTVGKHLERSFRKLGVGDRSSAAGRAWELAGGGWPVPEGSSPAREPAGLLAVGG